METRKERRTKDRVIKKNVKKNSGHTLEWFMDKFKGYAKMIKGQQITIVILGVWSIVATAAFFASFLGFI